MRLFNSIFSTVLLYFLYCSTLFSLLLCSAFSTVLLYFLLHTTLFSLLFCSALLFLLYYSIFSTALLYFLFYTTIFSLLFYSAFSSILLFSWIHFSYASLFAIMYPSHSQIMAALMARCRSLGAHEVGHTLGKNCLLILDACLPFWYISSYSHRRVRQCLYLIRVVFIDTRGCNLWWKYLDLLADKCI